MTDKMREEFEAWFSKNLGFSEDDHERMFSMFCDDGETHEYYRLSVRRAWLAWKASRVALCVELPQLEEPSGVIGIGFNVAKGMFIAKFMELGVRYK